MKVGHLGFALVADQYAWGSIKIGKVQMSAQGNWSAKETELLNAAVEKIVRRAEEIGLTPEDMIELLESGCSVRDLIAMLASRRSGLA